MRRIYKLLLGFFVLQIFMLALLAPLSMANTEPPGGGGGDDCCSKCGDCGPEFSPMTAMVTFLGMAFLLFFFRRRITHS